MSAGSVQARILQNAVPCNAASAVHGPMVSDGVLSHIHAVVFLGDQNTLAHRFVGPGRWTTQPSARSL